MSDVQVLRSVLYMPSSNERALEKAKSLPADAIIFDLEDAVAPDAKELAREQACAAVRSGEYGNRTLTIRCNGVDTPWGHADLRAIAAARPHAVVVPKVSGPGHLGLVESAVGADIRIWAMVETPAAIFSVREIAAHPQVDVLVMGTNDLAKELRAALVPGRAPLLPHLAVALLAAREAGIEILDGVYNDVKDLEGFEAEARQAAEMGFDGKTLVHPTQVEVANRVWAPTDDEVELARRVIEAFEQAEREGKGVVTVDGRMIENLHVENARRTLATAEAIAALG
ncbi:MAG TPA: CoA ester lyase [Mycobacteriales bacterium]|nr:CoA ester lyase [Mycobacteriales bacterium]